MSKKRIQLSRRDMLKLGLAGTASVVGGKALGVCGPGFVDQTPEPIATHDFTGCGLGGEPSATSPFILNPFTDPLPVPKAMTPGWRRDNGAPGGLLDPAALDAWTVRTSAFGAGVVAPGPEAGHQDAFGERPVYNALPPRSLALPPAGTHQLFPGQTPRWVNFNAQEAAWFARLPATPILYHIRIQVSEHAFTSSPVQPIDADGAPIPLPAGVSAAPGPSPGTYFMPPSTIYGFNGTFPGPMINFEYGKPAIVRFENDLDQNPLCRDRQDFGAPDWAFLTHLHNGHTAPESDGQPHHLQEHEGGYEPMEWSDNLYLGYPAGGDDTQKQSFLWFHDHRMHHTGPNVYKGMVGLMPHYDPAPEPNFPDGRDPGDETKGLRLPGVRTNNLDGSFDVAYDIPLALYDCLLDDGVTQHFSNHHFGTTGAMACGVSHPEWWGQLFLLHQPNHGTVGDVFTVNCTAYPRLVVERRKYRLRFLGASLSRIYDLSLRQGTPVPMPGMQGQWNLGTLDGQGRSVAGVGTPCMRMMQIASEGGLLPVPILRDRVEIWPAKRREVIVDFTRYQDGSPTSAGDKIYLTNTLEMLDGRKPTSNKDRVNKDYAVPLLMFEIGSSALAADDSVMPIAGVTQLRPAPQVNRNAAPIRSFTLVRGGTFGKETEWLINNLQFDPLNAIAEPRQGFPEAWTIANGGGGWVHPMHIHMEEHHVIRRTNKSADHRDDIGKEDVVALEPSETTVIYRNFRTFLGNYVAHCHNLAHEDHNMMFGWSIVP